MDFIQNIKEKARAQRKTIVLPEGFDPRVTKAANLVGQEDFADIILVGDEEEIRKSANGLDISKAKIINPITSPKYEEYVNAFYELRKSKGMTLEQARETIKDPVYFGAMMVKLGEADGMVSGAAHSTAETLRPALQIIRTAQNVKLVSSFLIMVVPNCELGEKGVFLFSDCGLNENPNAEQLSEIAVTSANTFKSLIGADPNVAMLSYSTYGSANSELTQKVIEATKLAKAKAPELNIDGEMQLDAAIIEHVGKSKAPGSTVAGKANILIFPDLNSGNIGYKLVERLAKAEAYGPVTQGIAKPVNDLSRGCKAEDIVGVVAITAVQAQL